MTKPAKTRTVANARNVRDIEALAETVRRHPELHHDSADRLLALARRIGAQGASAATNIRCPTKRKATNGAARR